MLFLERKKYRTPRQKEIKRLQDLGYSADEISKKLRIEIATVYLHSCNANKRDNEK